MKKILNIKTKPFYVAILFLCLLLNYSDLALADNLIVNGDFSNGFNGWTKFAMNGTPNISISTGSVCYDGQNGNPAASMDVYSGKKGAIEQQIQLPVGGHYALSFREWGQYQATNVTVKIYDGNNVAHPLDAFVAEQLISGYTYPGPVFQCTGNAPVTKTYDISQYAGQSIVLHVDATSTGYDGTFAVFDDFKIDADLGVSGMVGYRTNPGKGAAGITLHLTGTTTGGQAVDKTTQTSSDGKYAFQVSAGNYTVAATGEADYNDNGSVKKENGGVLSAVTSEGGHCEGSAVTNQCTVTVGVVSKRTADFSYTLCGSEDRNPNGKPLTHCPIVFVPGFLGSRITCNTGEVWPGLPLPGWGQMNLLPDGETNDASFGACNASADVQLGNDGVIDSVAGTDIYQSAMSFLDREALGRWKAAPYDWRKSPVIGRAHLEQVVDSLMSDTYAKHVVLYGHSMGGLVIRDYLNSSDNQKKVTRIITAGTPYWGAPKAHFALLGGYVDTPAGTTLDHLTWKTELQRMARNLQGAFFLYPSNAFGNWLSLANSALSSFSIQGPSGEDAWVQTLGGNPSLLDTARSWHDQNDGFPQTDIDYRAVVGAGSATVLESKVRRSTFQEPSGTFVIGNGDGTVPLRSATQGGSDNSSGQAFGKSVPLYYVCGVSHVDLPGNSQVLTNIRSFLLGGEEVTGLTDKCDFRGTVAYFSELSVGGGNSDVQTNVRSGPSKLNIAIKAGTELLTLDQAQDRGLVQYLPVGLTSALIIDDINPVTVTMRGNNIALQIQKVSSVGNGPLVAYKPVSGSVKFSSGTRVTAKDPKLVVAKIVKKLPTTTATISKTGNSAKVTLSATSPNGLLGTYYRIGTAAPQIYKKTFTVSLKQTVKVSFYSVDLYGLAEKAKVVTVRRH